MYDYRESRENWEWANLAPYSAHSSDPSLSWRRSDNNAATAHPHTPRARPVDDHFPDPQVADVETDDLTGSQSRFKTAFQIDKERIASSTAFRRLESKTQVFVAHEGDHFRTRLTHTIEVDETARSIAQALHLNEDLTNAIALGHDLGHTPFGHVGEGALNDLFREHWPEDEAPALHGGEVYGPVFFHNIQSVRVVDSLEKGYDWDRRPPNQKPNLDNPPIGRGWGLDPTWAVREGILKHSSRGLRASARDPIRMFGTAYLMDELAPFQPATLEGQVIEFADEIASLTHDVEDGLRSRVFKIKDVRELIRSIVPEAKLDDLLGLTEAFGNPISREVRLQSRAYKFHALLRDIREGDCTMGIVLAFLRNLLLSNLIEASAWRLRACLAGTMDEGARPQPADVSAAGPDELVWLHFTIQAAPGPTTEGYCQDAWEVDPACRTVRVQTYRRVDGRAEAVSAPEAVDARAFWNMRLDDPFYGRNVIVQRAGGRPVAYALGNVCITFGGAKIVGYHNNILDFRKTLRKDFIPEYLHNAPFVFRMNDKGRRNLTQIFNLYYEEPRTMHRSALKRFEMWDRAVKDDDSRAQLRKSKTFVLRIVENLQGMTDRFLNEEYDRLFKPGVKVDSASELDMVDLE